jgi:hypothetical protein
VQCHGIAALLGVVGGPGVEDQVAVRRGHFDLVNLTIRSLPLRRKADDVLIAERFFEMPLSS